MRRFRFTISSLLGVVLFAGVAFAAMREATALWDHVVFTLTACVLLVAVLLAIHRTASARAYWLGFALFGVAYLVATVIPSIESRLVTRRALEYLDSRFPGRSQPVVLTGTLNGTISGGGAGTFASAPKGFAVASLSQGGSVQLWNASTGRLIVGGNSTNEEFVRIGQSFLALLAALAGGWISRRLFLSGPRRDEENV